MNLNPYFKQLIGVVRSGVIILKKKNSQSNLSDSLFAVSGAPAAQCQPLFASNPQQHHPQSGPSGSPTIGGSVEHGPDGGLSDGGWRLHGSVSGGGAQPLCSLRRGDGGNGALPLTGAAGGRGGGQGEVAPGTICI